MTWIAIILITLLLVFSVKIYSFLFPIAFGIEQFLNLLLCPVDKLADLFIHRDSRLPGARFIRIVILGIVVVASVFFIISSMASGITIDDISDTMLSSTSLGQLMAFFGEERFGSSVKDQFTYTALVSLGLSSFLSFLYMRCTVETFEDFGVPVVINFLLVVVFNLAFICISALLSARIEVLCLTTAEKVQSAKLFLSGLYHTRTSGLLNMLKVFFSGLLLLILYLGGIYLIVVTAREVVAAFMYGFMSLLLTLVVGCFWSFIPEIFPNAPDWIHITCGILLNITLPIAMFLPDYIRATDAIKQYLIQEYLP